MSKKVLIVGDRAREHAIGWKLAQSPQVKELFFAPGNAGTGTVGKNIPIQISEIKKLAVFAKENKISLTIVGSDEPLALGIVDYFTKRGLRIFGPTKKAAQIEWSKAYAKQLMKNANIPTASYAKFSNYSAAQKYIKSHSYPLFIKASGLAEGKGAVRCENTKQARKTLHNLMVKKIFGRSGEIVVIEEYLTGEEISIHAFSDGKTYSLFPTAQDNKAVYEGNRGPNTGGVGTIAPVPLVSKKQLTEIGQKIVSPVLTALRKQDRPFAGNLYPGLMMTRSGPKVIEYNARFGDPEMESYVRLLKTDLFDICMACAEGKLSKINIRWSKKYACCIVLAAGGYPGKYKKGDVISGIGNAEKDSDIVIFHFGTKQLKGRLVTNGGRILGVTAVGKTMKEALSKGYKAVSKIRFKGMHYRRDIGKKYR